MTAELPIDKITDYHAHIYFASDSKARAVKLRDALAKRFPVAVGRMHERPVGPHPRWSVQVAFGAALYGEIVPWMMLNRDGLTIFLHPNTGQDLEDHRDRAVWMGEMLDLELSIFD